MWLDMFLSPVYEHSRPVCRQEVGLFAEDSTFMRHMDLMMIVWGVGPV